jgi:hypothetical protein
MRLNANPTKITNQTKPNKTKPNQTKPNQTEIVKGSWLLVGDCWLVIGGCASFPAQVSTSTDETVSDSGGDCRLIGNIGSSHAPESLDPVLPNVAVSTHNLSRM